MRAVAASLAVLTMAALSAVGGAQPARAEPVCGPEPATWASAMTDVAIPMRDGVCLRANLFLPDTPGRYPVIFAMTPYRKDDPRSTKPSIVDSGFVYALVDVRGIGNSDGVYDNVFSPAEQQDGADLAHWFAAPERLWNQGVHQKVGMMGQSYVGITQWFTAEQPGVEADLGAIFPCKAYSDIYRDIVFHGGILDSLFAIEWGFGTGLWWTLPPAPWTEAGTSPDVYEAWLLHLQNEPVITKALEHPYDDALFAERSVYPRAHQIKVPAYHCGGWYDGFLRGTLDTWRLVGARAGSSDRMVIGPWPHMEYFDFDLAGARLAWFDHWLKGIDNGIDRTDTPIHLFVMRGASQDDGEWRDETEWPLARTAFTDWYLQPSGGLANVSPPSDGGGDMLLANSPAGASLTAGRWSNVSGVTPFENPDQRVDEAFGLTYTTAPFARDVELTGPFVLHLWATVTGAADVDLFAKVTDVAPDGTSTYLTEGFLRASHRAVSPPCEEAAGLRCSLPWQPFHPHTEESVAAVPSGVPLDYDIEIWPTANTFPAGHALRLDLYTGDLPNHFSPPNPGLVTVLHDTDHPSRLTVPLIAAPATGERTAAADPNAPATGNTPARGDLPATGPASPIAVVGLVLLAAAFVARRVGRSAR
jgi:putative CocE/NonD family hydrolase